MTCKLCERFWNRIWAKSDDWERDHSNDSEIWSRESHDNQELIERATVIREADPAGAFALYLQAAESGSVWAAQMVGWCYHQGSGVEADFEKSQDFLRRAITGGSWMATIDYARLLFDNDYFENAESLLEEGVSAGFEPAFFWLARLRHQQSESDKVRREYRHLLEDVARVGHPLSRHMLASHLVRGKFGFRQIPAGLMLVIRYAIDHAREEGARAEDQVRSSDRHDRVAA